MVLNCKECETEMKKTASINSGNANIETWTCPNCGETKQICTGLIN